MNNCYFCNSMLRENETPLNKEVNKICGICNVEYSEMRKYIIAEIIISHDNVFKFKPFKFPLKDNTLYYCVFYLFDKMCSIVRCDGLNYKNIALFNIQSKVSLISFHNSLMKHIKFQYY